MKRTEQQCKIVMSAERYLQVITGVVYYYFFFFTALITLVQQGHVLGCLLLIDRYNQRSPRSYCLDGRIPTGIGVTRVGVGMAAGATAKMIAALIGVFLVLRVRISYFLFFEESTLNLANRKPRLRRVLCLPGTSRARSPHRLVPPESFKVKCR